MTQVAPQEANRGLSFMGVKLVGDFVVTREEAAALGLGRVSGLERHIRRFRNGRDITQSLRDVLVIDLFGLEEADVRARFPAVYQHVLTRVKPVREAKRGRTNDATEYADRWMEFANPRQQLRAALERLPRYIVTSEVSKHRFFVFLDADVLPDGALIAITTGDAYHLGVLSSGVHVTWALAAGGRLEDRPRYNPTRCFEPFPFPAATDAQAEAIRLLAEAVDAHRKARQAAHPGLGLTDLYNVVEKLRAGQPLTAKEQAVHADGLASVLLDLHRQLDRAVAYGWMWPLAEAEILVRLVALNAERKAEEAAGHVRYLRPAFQAPQESRQATISLEASPTPADRLQAVTAWPSSLSGRIAAVRRVVEAAPAPLDAPSVAARFQDARAGEVREVLVELVELGLVHVDDGQYVK